MINWKLIIILITLLIILLTYLFGYFGSPQWSKDQIITPHIDTTSIVINENVSKKIRQEITNQEEFKKIKVPDNMTLYYFPGECPDYTKDIFIYINSGGLDRYFVPEEKTLILVKKDHKWTSSINFLYWIKNGNDIDNINNVTGNDVNNVSENNVKKELI